MTISIQVQSRLAVFTSQTEAIVKNLANHADDQLQFTIREAVLIEVFKQHGNSLPEIFGNSADLRHRVEASEFMTRLQSGLRTGLDVLSRFRKPTGPGFPLVLLTAPRSIIDQCAQESRQALSRYYGQDPAWASRCWCCNQHGRYTAISALNGDRCPYCTWVICPYCNAGSYYCLNHDIAWYRPAPIRIGA